ncbi:MAG: BamA/TamA family outer membrane protein [Deltaproteobacteria bacterium]|nr:BamA/TamA family outer membrane protein [Deltaproteobacteria bacterium]
MPRNQSSLLVAACVLLSPVQGMADEESPLRAPRYVIEAIRIVGAKKTKSYVIRRALTVKVGEGLAVDDPRFDASRFRVLSLGFFSDVQLRLKKGSRRGLVVLLVQVKERGTILLSDIFLGLSEATEAWGGLGLAEKNLFGRGIGLEGAFVFGADPDVERGALQQAYWLRLSAPRGSFGLELNTSFLYLDGSEFFRQAGSERTSTPDDFLSVRYRRLGGTAGVGFNLGSISRMTVDYRGEAVEASVPRGAVWRHPSGRIDPIAFDIMEGNSVLSLVSAQVEFDTRSDPILPEHGWILTLGMDASTQLIGSSYSYLKLSSSYRHFFGLPWRRHILALGLLGGVIFGDAPFFEKFFIGDLNDLVPSRSLGLNFSTLPSRDFFGTSIDSMRYEDLALRATVEYIIPWFRGGEIAYSLDFFFRVGVIFLASKEDLMVRDRALGESFPLDLTIDAGLRFDTRIGIFRFSIGNGLGRVPF